MSEIEEEVNLETIWYKLGEILNKMETRILDRLDLLIENQLTKTIFENSIKYEISTNKTEIKTPGEKTSAAEKKSPEIKKPKTIKPKIEVKKDKEEDYILENVKVKFETEKAYLLLNENDMVAWIPKKCMKSLDTIKNIAIVHGWFSDKVKFEKEEPF